MELFEDPFQRSQRARGNITIVYCGCRCIYYSLLHDTLQIYVDDVLVYRGSLKRSPKCDELPAPSSADSASSDDEFSWGDCINPNLSQSIIFSNDPKITSSEVSSLEINKMR